MSFQRIYDYITDNSRCPQLAVKNTRIIQEWVLAGYDFERDIKPAVDKLTKGGGLTIYSYGFFNDEICKTHQARVKRESEKHIPQEELDAKRAKIVAWHRDKGVRTTRVGQHDFDWLEKYELKHGRVEA